MHLLKILSINKLIYIIAYHISCRTLQCSAMILIARQYNLPSTRYIFPRSTGQNFDSGFKLDLAVLDDNPPPYLGSPVRNGALLIQSRSSVAPNKVSSCCLHTYPRCPGAGARWRSATSQLLREGVRVLCPLNSAGTDI